jgi:hypothetical protein
MMDQRLSPAVQHGEEADLRAEMLGIGRDGASRLGRRTKQDAVDPRFVLEGDGRAVGRHGEDDVEILAVEDLGSPARDPGGARQRLTLGTVPIPAGVVRDALVPTGVALFDMSAEGGRPARLDSSWNVRVVQ